MVVEERLNPSFDWLKKKERRKLFFFRSMVAQQYSIWLKIGACSCEFLMASCICFWILGSQESNSLNGLQFGVETKEIWSFEVKLRRGYAVTGLHTGPILFACLGSSFGPLLGLKVAKLWLLYRSFFGKFWCQILVSSWRQLTLIHNWKVVKIIPWP